MAQPMPLGMGERSEKVPLGRNKDRALAPASRKSKGRGNVMREFFRRIYYLLNRRKLERDLAHDIAAHREMLSEESRKDFGNPTLLVEQSRDAWGWGWLDRLFQDLRFGARMFRHAPGLALTAITVLAFGIGVNVTGFNLVDIIYFRPLPVRDPHSLVRFTTQFKNGSSTNVAYPVAAFYRDNSSALASVMVQTGTHVTLNEGATSSIRTDLVSANYFKDLGVSAAYGRLFSPQADAAPDAAPVVVLGNEFFQRHFGGNPEIVGQTIRINQHPATVIGVLPYRFTGMDPERAIRDEVWLPIEKAAYFVPDSQILLSFDQNDSGVRMYGRLKPGITFQAGEQALLPLAQELVQEHPDKLQKGEHLRLSAGGYAEEFNANDAPAFGLFAVLVLLILATTCGNLGNLLLGHAFTREREISIRLSLGATRGRIIRQLVTESFLLAMLGSAAALVLSWYASRTLLFFMGGPTNMDLAPDWRTMVFALGIGTCACLLFGLPPALQLVRQRHRASRMRTFFMATQVAASCVLLVLSALLVHALERALNSDPGFDYAHVVVVDPQLYSHSYSASAALQFTHDLQERIRQMPGVEASSPATYQPLGHNVSDQRARAADGSAFDIYLSHVGPQFFETMSIPLLRGRTFKEGEHDAAIVSESTARRLWPEKDALQQPISSTASSFRLSAWSATPTSCPCMTATLVKLTSRSPTAS